MFSNPTSLDLYNLEFKKRKLRSQNFSLTKSFPRRKLTNTSRPPMMKVLPFAVEKIKWATKQKTRLQQQRKDRVDDLLYNTMALGGRLIDKNGHYCVEETHIPERTKQYMRDFYTTLIESAWPWAVLLFISTYLGSYTLFATIYYLDGYVHGDLKVLSHNGSEITYALDNPCIENGRTFIENFLFSVETQQTIGYGFRFPSVYCPVTNVVTTIQTWIGVVIEAFMLALLLSKLTRPKQRAKTLIFSKNAVICQRDGHLCLMFRLGDMRPNNLILARVRLILITSYKTREHEVIPFHMIDLPVEFAKHQQEDIFLAWPVIICHVINDDSPLYHYAKADMISKDFEIIALIEGTVESTGQSTQARTSYKPNEILWGHRFETLLTYQCVVKGVYTVNWARFHESYAVPTPECSAAEMSEESHRLNEEAKLETKWTSIHFPLKSQIGSGRLSPVSESISSEHTEGRERCYSI